MSFWVVFGECPGCMYSCVYNKVLLAPLDQQVSGLHWLPVCSWEMFTRFLSNTSLACLFGGVVFCCCLVVFSTQMYRCLQNPLIWAPTEGEFIVELCEMKEMSRSLWKEIYARNTLIKCNCRVTKVYVGREYFNERLKHSLLKQLLTLCCKDCLELKH